MDAITLMMTLFLQLSEPCNALPLQQTTIGGQEYQILSYACGPKLFQVWQRWCDDGEGFWSRPFYLAERVSGLGFYLNRFAEVQPSVQVDLSETYVPRCGT